METKQLRPDICVIGAGSAGLTVAAAAAAFGVPVVLVEKGEMGGDCLNYGCVPSKALIAAANHVASAREAAAFGVGIAEPKVDFGRVNRHVRAVIAAIAPNDSVARFEAMGVTVLREAARFIDGRTVEAGPYRIRARRFVVATGSSPLIPPIEGLDTVSYMTNETLFERTRKPQHLVIIGGGPIGVEMAQAHRRLGAAVTVIEGATILGNEDPEIVALVRQRLQSEGVEILENTSVRKVEQRGKTRIAVIADSDGEEARTIQGTDLLVATGRRPNVEELGLDESGIRHDKRGIEVKRNLRTSNRRVYAIGDVVAGGLRFTHVGNYQAGLVLQQILFRLPAKEDRTALPRVTFLDPELAHVGLTEAEARQRHRRVGILRWPLSENDRAQAERRVEGLIKLVVGRRGRVLGATVYGHAAGEMISFWTLAITRKMTVADIRGYVAPYPTFSEIGKRAAIAYYGPATRKPLVRRLVAFLRRFG